MCAIPELAAVDGWLFFRVVEETPSVLRAVGIIDFLPSSELPIDARFRMSGDSIEYQIFVGNDDEKWRSLSESKRWKAVYGFAVDGAEPLWKWDRPVVGQLEN